jgi:diphosphomevalonate decarboxylase
MGNNFSTAAVSSGKFSLMLKTYLKKEQEGVITWRSPSNIALVKYWGKRSGQIPENPSVSISLSTSFTETTISYSQSGNNRGILKGFKFNGKQEDRFGGRIRSYLGEIESLFPFLANYNIDIDSRNSFPHSSGIASSASAFSALALCITSMERALTGSPSEDSSFFIKASYAARMGSGSAARSVYPGYVLWGSVPEVPYSVNEFAVPVNDMIHESFKDIRNAIMLVDVSAKAVSSSKGHSMMNSNPWSAIRYEQARRNVVNMLEALRSGDSDEFIRIIESEALTLHALMMSSENGYLLMKPGTLEIIEKVREFRKRSGIPLAFTLDAGPNVHLIYPASQYEKVREFIVNDLLVHCRNGEWIDDQAGNGPEQIFSET